MRIAPRRLRSASGRAGRTSEPAGARADIGVGKNIAAGRPGGKPRLPRAEIEGRTAGLGATPRRGGDHPVPVLLVEPAGSDALPAFRRAVVVRSGRLEKAFALGEDWPNAFSFCPSWSAWMTSRPSRPAATPRETTFSGSRYQIGCAMTDSPPALRMAAIASSRLHFGFGT